MSIVDRIAQRLGFVRAQSELPAPARARRVRLSRSFAGGGTNNLTAGWSTSDQHVNQSLYRGLRAMRARSRDLSRNNDYARQFLRMVRNNVVGPHGVVMQANVRAPDGSIDRESSARIEAAWSAWGRRESCDHVRAISWVEMQRLYIETVARDGEILVRRMRGKNAGPHGYALQLIDPAMLDETHNADLEGGARIRMGIELDADSRPIAYHLIAAETYDPRRLGVGARTYRRVPAADIWHDYVMEYVGQLRGVPWMATTMVRQKRLASFEDAAVAAAEEGAKKVAWLKSPTGDLAALAETQAGADADATPAPEAGTLYTESGEGVHYASLPPGYDLQDWDPKYPDQAFGDFVKATLRGISAGLGVAYHNLANDLEGVNFSSSRTGTIEEREHWKALQSWMIDRLCVRTYAEWLPIAVATGALDWRPQDIELIAAPTWSGRRWQWVDPLKDVNARVAEIEAGLTSRTRVIREQGYDPEDVWSELEYERERLAGIIVTDAPPRAPAPQTTEPDDDAPAAAAGARVLRAVRDR